MTYESDAVAGLHDAAQAAYAACWEAGAQFAKGSTAVAKAGDIVDTLAKTIDLLVWAEALHKAADATVAAIRAKLAETMEAVGATSVQATHHSAHLSRKPAFLNAYGEASIPREWFVQPPPALDKRALLAALKDGKQVPGASVGIPNTMTLVLRPRKETPT